jgi:hypothetical protein
MANSYKKKPTAKHSLAQQEQLQAARRHNSQNVSPTSCPTKNTLQKDLKNTRKVLLASQERLHTTEQQLELTTTQLSRTQSTLISVQNNYAILNKNNAELYRLLRNERCTTPRYAATKRDLKGEITGLSTEAQICLRMHEILTGGRVPRPRLISRRAQSKCPPNHASEHLTRRS